MKNQIITTQKECEELHEASIVMRDSFSDLAGILSQLSELMNPHLTTAPDKEKIIGLNIARRSLQDVIADDIRQYGFA